MSTTTEATTDQRALYAGILANPDDITARLVYADYLDENGNPARAEFIRVQCELARMPPEPRELFVADGAGALLAGIGVALTPRGGGHYSASTAESGLSAETFAPGERVDIYAHLARNDRIGWMRGLRYVKTVEDRHEIIFRTDAGSGPWVGTELSARESALLAAHGAEWRRGPKCSECEGVGRINYGLADGACGACHGTGDGGGLLRSWNYPIPGHHDGRAGWVGNPSPARLRWWCGFPDAVTVPVLEDVSEPARVRCAHGCHFDNPKRIGWKYRRGCPQCFGQGSVLDDTHTPTPWARRVVAAHPVRRFAPLDRVPTRNPVGFETTGWAWVKGSASPGPLPAAIPDPIFESVKRREAQWCGVSYVAIWPTSEVAGDALALALATCARS